MQERVVQLVNTPSEEGTKELTTTVRSVAEIRKASVDAARSSITIQGTTDRLAFADWLVHASANTNPRAVATVLIPTIRNTMKIQRMFAQTTPHVIVARSSLAELAQAQKILEAR